MKIIGDVHGKFDKWREIVDSCSESVQIGDFGFKYPDKAEGHYFFPGNHDNQDNLPDYCLGRFGYVDFMSIPFFFVSGECSIDRFHRTEGLDWWRNEELSYAEDLTCIEIYKSIKPEVMLSHGAPSCIRDRFSFPHNHTSELLQTLFDFHQPKVWLFGHFHRSWYATIDNTFFRCLNELEVCDLGEFYES